MAPGETAPVRNCSPPPSSSVLSSLPSCSAPKSPPPPKSEGASPEKSGPGEVLYPRQACSGRDHRAGRTRLRRPRRHGGTAIAQPASQESSQNASAEAPSKSTSPRSHTGRQEVGSHARRSTTVLRGRIPGAWGEAALLSGPAPASEHPPEAQADRHEDADEPEEVPVALGDARQGLLRGGQRRARPCACRAEIGL